MNKYDTSSVDNLVQYLYTGDYGNVKEEALATVEDSTGTLHTILTHIHAHDIAYHYNIRSMMNVTDSKLQSLLKKQSNNADLAPALPKAIETAQALTSSRGLMDGLAVSSADHINELV